MSLPFIVFFSSLSFVHDIHYFNLHMYVFVQRKKIVIFHNYDDPNVL